MPCYQAIIMREDLAIPSCVFKFVAGTDMQAVSRMPAVEGDCTVEIWRGTRLIAIIDAETAVIADCNLAAVAARMIGRIETR